MTSSIAQKYFNEADKFKDNRVYEKAMELVNQRRMALRVSLNNRCWCDGELSESVHPLYVRCLRCGTLVAKTSSSVEELAKFYSLQGYWHDYQQAVSGYPAIEERAISDFDDRIPFWFTLVRGFAGQPQSLLEIGCSHGGFLSFCRDRGITNAVGVEVDEETCRFARNRFNLPHVYSGLFPNVKLPFASFDVITGFDVIEHFPDPLAGIRSVSELLSERGVFIFQTPCYRGEDGAWLQFRPVEHLFLYDETNIRKLFDQCGLEVTEILPGYFPDDMFVIGRKKSDLINILYLRTDSIGDNVLASSMLPYIREIYKHSIITVVCQEHIAELYEVCPFVDNIIRFNKIQAYQDEKYRVTILQHLRAIDADIALNSVYSREPLTDTFTIGSDAKERLAFNGNLCNISNEIRNKHNQLYTKIVPSSSEHKPEIERHRDFLRGFGIDTQHLQPIVWTTPEDEQFAEEFFCKNNLSSKKTIALFAGAQGEIRFYRQYGTALSQICKDKQFTVLAFGTEREQTINQQNLDDIGSQTINLSGKTTLRQTATLLKRCSLAVGAETGTAHIACAVGTPNVILLGGGHFGRFMPYSLLTSVVCLPLECYGCNWSCKYQTVHCVKDIIPEVIKEAVRQTLENKSEKPRVFVQGSSLWNPQTNQPQWQWFNKFLDTNSVEIIPVGDVPPLAKTVTEMTDTTSQQSIELLNLQAKQELQNGNIEKAEEILLNVINQSPNNIKALNNLAVTKILKKNWDSATDTLQKVLKLDPSNKIALENIKYLKIQMSLQKSISEAENFIESKQYPQAREILEKVLAIDDKHIDALNDLAVIEISQNNFREAQALLNNILQIDSSNEIAKNNLECLNKYLGSHRKQDQTIIPTIEDNYLPKISVVTPSFNQAKYIEQTIKSVLEQKYPNIEHIIIDGGSTDGTSEILKKYPHIKWLSEKDRGQSDAINKGFQMVSGDIIAWINSDDWYESNTFKVIADYFVNNPEKNIVMGNCNLIDENGNVFDKVINFERGFDKLKMHWIPRSIPTQPAIFFRKKLLDKFGFLDISLHYAMDYDLWMRFAKENIFYHINQTFANYRFHSLAKGGDQDWNKFIPECKLVYKRYVKTNTSPPKVSVIIPCYNYGCYLPDAVNSVLSQTYQDLEIIIVNDGSTDNTKEVAEHLINTHPLYKIKLINQENSGQPAISRNRGISEATGKYILCLDADDKIEPAMIEECVKLLENHPEVSIAYTDQIYFDDKSSRKVQVYDYDFSHLIQSNFMGYCSLFRRKAWEVSGGFPADVGYEDWDFWITCGEKGHFGKRIHKHLFCYRTHKEGRYQKDLKKDAEIKAHIVMKHPMLYDERTKERAKKIIELSNNIENVLKKRFKIIAIISAHNEGDIIYQVIGDLIKQGVEVYFINHCSTDNTVEEASKWLGKGLIHIENFPQDANYPEQNKQEYIWSHILKRKQELAAILDADWFIHHDADEFRESPWPGLSLFEAIYVVDRSGYNAIDFELLNFRPTDNSFVSGADVRDAFKYYELSEDFNKLQIKAWKKQKQPVDLATTGGHDVQFEGKKVYPIKFILRHYPVRSQTHGMQKVFQERKSRFNRQERSWGWHVQYNKVTDEQYNFLYNPSSLKLYNESDIRLLLLSQQAYAIKQQLLKESGLSTHNMPGEFFTNADDLFHCGEYNEAIDAYKKALETNPYPNQQLQPKEVSRLFDAYYNLALSYVNTHRLDDAITTFQKAVELHSGDATIYNNLGVLYFKKKSYNNARSFFEKALSLDNHYGEARQNLEKASHALKNCSDVTPGNPDDNKVFTDSPVVSHLRDDSETTKCLFEQNEKFNLAVSIIIPVFNKVEYTKKCIEAIKLNTPHDLLYETIIVDNASTDGTQDFLKSLRPDVKAITNKENLGFARACNQGASAARGRLLCFLNNDTSPTTGWLRALIDAANKPSVGVVGAKLLYPDGRIQHAGIEFINGIPDHPYRYAHRDAQEVNRYREMDMVTGACLVISKELFYTLAGFDEIYRNGVEDIDLCVRIRLAGFKVVYEPKAVIFHYEGQSAGRFNHVRENLQIFFNRWKNRFGINGQLKIPESANIIISEMSLLKEQTHVACRWEGSQFVYHSLALINRELCLQLMDSGYEISIIPYEPDQFGADADPRFKEISQHINKPLTGKADVHVRHQWPPNLTPPLEGHWVIIQPWEFGSLPEEWVRVFSTQVDEMWTPSNYVRQVYIDSGVPAERVVVIPNGINPEKFHPEVKPYQLETQKKFKFLFVGGTIYRKGIDLLLQAYLDTFKRSDDVCLVIKDMGGNSFYAGQTFKKEIERIQQNKELPEVEYIEQTLSEAELVGLYTASDVLAHPYRGEGFGLPILEAMACGIPAIVTNGGACLDFCNSKNSLPVKATKKLLQEKLIGDRKTVDYPWMFEVEIEDLKKKMRYAYENPGEMNALGKEISSNVRNNWTWERSAQKIKERIEFLRKLPILRYTKDNSSDHTLDVSRESELFNMANVGCVERSETQQIP